MTENSEDILFYEYFDTWYKAFREPQVRPVTAKRYKTTQEWIKKLAPDLYINRMNRLQLQKLINDFGKDHEIGTVRGFYAMLKACIEDAKYEGTIAQKDPTYHVRVSSKKKHVVKHAKYLERNQAESLAEVMEQDGGVLATMFDFDMRTGLRLAELLGITPKDVDLEAGTINVNKSWLYKQGKDADFGDTKNKYSHRVILIDELAKNDLRKYLNDCDEDEPIFVKALSQESKFKPTEDQKYKAIYNVELNRALTKFCKEADVPRLGIHGLRHTHASLLFDAGISILSISKRLGHSNTATTEKIYLHLINDKKQKDDAKMMNALNTLGLQGAA